jgi:hypothetical protein
LTVPSGLTHAAFETWAGDHPDEAICNLNMNITPNTPNGPEIGNVIGYVPCGGPGGPGGQIGFSKGQPNLQGQSPPTHAQLVMAARAVADFNYVDYSDHFLSPPVSLMVRSGLWIELYAAIGFLVGLGLASLMGQRTVPVILLIVLEIVLTPLLAHANIPYVINLQRGLVALATIHLEPAGLVSVFGNMGGGGGGPPLVTESTTVAICVIVGWIVVWTGLGAWRMVTRDA